MGFDRRTRLYICLCGVFLTALLIGDTIGAKLFTIDIPLGVTTLQATLSVGSMWFPITFLLTDVINEFYGAAGARLVTYLGFAMALVAFFFILAARSIPAASFSPIDTATFTKVFGNANRIFVASLVAYLIGQLSDIAMFHSVKRLTQARHIWLRSTGSTLVSQIIDTLVVTWVGLYGKIPDEQLWRVAFTSYVVKVLVAVGLTPVIYALHGLIHRMLSQEDERLAARRARDLAA